MLSADGRCAAKPRGGSISPLEKHADFLLGLIEKQPDLTLDEVVLAMRKHKIPGGRTAVWRFFKRHKITFTLLLRCAQAFFWSSQQSDCGIGSGGIAHGRSGRRQDDRGV